MRSLQLNRWAGRAGHVYLRRLLPALGPRFFSNRRLDTPRQNIDSVRCGRCSFNPLTKGRQYVSNFSAQCNERPQKQRAEFRSQRKIKPMFSLLIGGVFRATDGVLDFRTRDTPRSKSGENQKQNVGVRASRMCAKKGGVAYGDQSRIVSLDFTFVKNFGRTGTNPQSPPRPQGHPLVCKDKRREGMRFYSEYELNLTPVWFTGEEWANGTAQAFHRQQYKAAFADADKRRKQRGKVTTETFEDNAGLSPMEICNAKSS